MKEVLIYLKRWGEISKVIDLETNQEIMFNCCDEVDEE